MSAFQNQRPPPPQQLSGFSAYAYQNQGQQGLQRSGTNQYDQQQPFSNTDMRNVPSNPTSQRFINYNSQANIQSNTSYNINQNQTNFSANTGVGNANLQPNINVNQVGGYNPSLGYINTPKNNNFGTIQQTYSNTSIQSSPFNRQPQQQNQYGSNAAPSQYAQQNQNFTSSVRRDSYQMNQIPTDRSIGYTNYNNPNTQSNFQNQMQLPPKPQMSNFQIQQQQQQQQQGQQNIQGSYYLPHNLEIQNNNNNENNIRRIQPAINVSNKQARSQSKENEQVRFSDNIKNIQFEETESVQSPQLFGGSFQVPQQPSMFRKVSQNRNLSEGTGINMVNSPDINNSMQKSSQLRKQKSFYKYNQEMLADALDNRSLTYQFLESQGEKTEKQTSIFALNAQKRWINKAPHSRIMKKVDNLVKVIDTKYGIQQKQGSIDIFASITDAAELKANLMNRVKTQLKLIKALEQVVNESSSTHAKELLELVKAHQVKKTKIKQLALDGRAELDLEGQLIDIHKAQLDAISKLELIEYKYDFGGHSDSKKRAETTAKIKAATPKEHRKITSELLQQRLADARDQCEATKYVISQAKEKDLESKFIKQGSSLGKSAKGSPDNSKAQFVFEIPLDQVIQDAIFLIKLSLPDFKEAWQILVQDELNTQSLLIDIGTGNFNLQQCILYKQIKYEPLKKNMLKYLHVIFLDLRLPIRKNNEINVQVFDCFLKNLKDIQESIGYYISFIDKTMKLEQNYFFSFAVNEELNKQRKYLQYVESFNKTNIDNIQSLKKQFSEIVNPMDVLSKYKSNIESLSDNQLNQKEMEQMIELHKNSLDIQQQIQTNLQQINLDKIKIMCVEFELPYDLFLQILNDQIEKEINYSKKNVKFIEAFIAKQKNVESEFDESIKKLQNQGLNLVKQWEMVDEGKTKFQLDELENFYKQLKETLEGIGSHLFDPQVRCNISYSYFKKALKIYNALKIIHKKVLKHVFLQKEIHLIDLKVFQGLVQGLDLTDSKSEAEFKKYCNMIQGIQTMVGIEQENQEFKQIYDANQGFFQLIELFMVKHNLFKKAYEKALDLTKQGGEYSIEPFNESLRQLCTSDRSLQKSYNVILSFSQELHKRCIDQINKKAIEQNISQKNQLIDQLTLYKNDIYARIEQFYLFIFENEQTYEIVGGIENVYSNNKIDFQKFQDQIKILQRKFKNQPLHFQVLDGYNLEAQQNILLTKYFIGLNNFLLKQSNSQQSKSIQQPLMQSKYNTTDDFVTMIQSLFNYHTESKIELYLKKRKNVNIEIYHRFETISKCFYSFFDYAIECNRSRISFTQCFENCKKVIDLGDANFVQNVNGCLDLYNTFEKRIETFISEMKKTKLNSFYLFSSKIIDKVKTLVVQSLQPIDIKFLTKLQQINSGDRYKECHMNYTNAYQEVKQYLNKQQKKKQIKDFLDDLHSVYLPRVRMSLTNSLINRENFYQFLPELKNTEMFDEIKFISNKFENHKHKNCEAFFNSLYDIVHLYVQQKHNLREQKELMNKVTDLFQKHNQNFQMNLQRDLSSIFQTIIRDDYDLSKNFKI